MTELKKLIRSQNLVERHLGEETVLVPINQLGVVVQSIYTLNPTAAFIWNLLENTCTVTDIIEAIAQEYSAKDETIQQDVKRILAEFLQESIATVVVE